MRKIQIDWQIVVKFSELIKGMPEDKPIFVGQDKIYNSTVNDVLTRHCRACGISVISIHGLRHTHASLLLFCGSVNCKRCPQIGTRKHDNNAEDISAHY